MTAIWKIKVSDGAEHLTMSGEVATMKNYLSQVSVEIEKVCCNGEHKKNGEEDKTLQAGSSPLCSGRE